MNLNGSWTRRGGESRGEARIGAYGPNERNREKKRRKKGKKISTNREKRENVGMKERTSRMTEIGQMGGQNSRKI